jgi:hypothetical protein
MDRWGEILGLVNTIESGRRGRAVLSNLDLEHLFTLAVELLARREKLKLKEKVAENGEMP